ncbi:MAG: DUF4421 family protein [Bacteroidales bacterium]|nr:DUF4421 family protein [Bacteroidales bacterium]
MRKIAVILLSILFLAPSLSAQDEGLRLPDGIVKKVLGSLTRPNPKVDTAYILKSPLPWSFTLDNSLIATGASFHSDIDITEFQPNDLTFKDGVTTHAVFENSLQRHLHTKMGLSVGYGSLRVSGGLELGSKNPGKNSFISLSLRMPTFGGTIRYIRLKEYMDGSLSVEGTSPIAFTSEYPGTMLTITGDVYYLFNGLRFDYNATQGCVVDQRRSAGSVMTLAKYLQGDLSMDKRDRSMLSFTNGLFHYSTQQFSIGLGYSYNFVLFHRDSDDSRNWIGYRNLTLNMTAIPMASLYNHIYSLEEMEDGSVNKTKFDGSIVPSFTLRSGLSFSWGRYSIVSTVVYNRFGFNGMRTTIWTPNHRVKNEFDTKADFDDLTAKTSLVVRF